MLLLPFLPVRRCRFEKRVDAVENSSAAGEATLASSSFSSSELLSTGARLSLLEVTVRFLCLVLLCDVAVLVNVSVMSMHV